MNTSVLKEGSVSLSPQDRLILEGYKPLVDAIGQLFGDCCEVVLHSLEDLSHSVIWIHNGAKTGRKIGSPVTDKALSVLRQCEQTGSSFSKLYLTQTVNGATMRSTTTVIKGIAGNPIGLFCINFDISMPFNQLAQILVEPKNEGEAGGEHFAIDLDDLFLTKVRQVEQEVKNDPRESSKFARPSRVSPRYSISRATSFTCISESTKRPSKACRISSTVGSTCESLNFQ